MLKRYFRKVSQANKQHKANLLKDIYHQWVAERRIQLDNTQLEILEDLQLTLNELNLKKPVLKQQSLYLYGDVGRGKSMLMQLFYDACSSTKKKRFHYSQFMSELHAYSHASIQLNKSEILTGYANQLNTELQLLFIDEFYVTDIADAMLLERLFTRLFELNITIIITSNRHPNDLYQGGIQKAQFAKFTDLLQINAKILTLNSDIDYRLSYLKSAQQVFYTPLDRGAKEFIRNAYQQLTDDAPLKPYTIKSLGRSIALTAAYQDIVLTDFNELCEQALGSYDYIEMTKQFKVVIMANIPKLSYEKRNQAKRFMTLIDALYEHNVKLICSAETPIEDLYVDGDGVFEFKRTVSRLIEMQAQNYLDSDHN